MKVRRSMLKDTVSVESYAGEGAYGPVYIAARTIPCKVEAARHLVRNANGDEAVSEATMYVHPQDAAAFAPESLVTIDGRATRVLAASSQTFRGRTSFMRVTCGRDVSTAGA